MTVYVPQDVLPPVKAFLEPEMGVEVRQNFPPDYKSTDAPFLLIANDGGPMQYPVSTRPTVRLTAYAEGRGEAVRLASKAMGLLLCRRVPGIANVRPGSNLIDDRDEKTKAFFASTTVLVTIRTAAL
jgi:hypothetical protein